jgi:hypothetical protein
MTQRSRSYFFLAFFTCSVQVVLADNLFAGCYNFLPSGSVRVANQASSTACTVSDKQTSSPLPLTLRWPADLQSACQSNTHSYYNASSTFCYCSNGTPFQQYLQPGNADNCGLNYDNRNVKTSFMSWSPPCFDTLPAGLTPTGTTPTGLNACLRTCASSLQATFWGNTAVSRLA